MRAAPNPAAEVTGGVPISTIAWAIGNTQDPPESGAARPRTGPSCALSQLRREQLEGKTPQALLPDPLGGVPRRAP